MAVSQETSESRWKAAAFWGTAAAILLIALGVPSLRGSEDRFAEITREMFVSGDFLHPTLNGESHFHKPLLSYWAIAGASRLVGGLGELSARLPSALSGLVALVATVSLGTSLWGVAAGRFAGWVLLTMYGFAFWGRTAAADMENVAAIIAAVAWFRLREDRPGFVLYAVFGLICVVGAHAKGLAAIVLPVLVLAPHLVRHARWRDHARPAPLLAAVLLSAAVYLAPFVSAEAARPGVGSMVGAIQSGDPESGLYMVFQENIRRFYAPHDHRGSVLTYVLALPVLMLPWALVFVAALADYVRDRARLDPETRWVAWSIGLIFTVFTLSGSRRSYYILPILPFCALLIAAVGTSDARRRFLDPAVRWTLLGLLAVAGVEAAAAVLAYPVGLAYGVPVSPALIVISLCLAYLSYAVWRQGDRRGWPPGFVAVALSAILLGGYFGLQYPLLDRYRTEKPFALALAQQARDLAPGRVAFVRHAPALFAFYLQSEVPLPVLHDAASIDAFALEGDGLIVASPRALRGLEQEVERFDAAPDLREPLFPWDPPGDRLGAWRTAVLSKEGGD